MEVTNNDIADVVRIIDVCSSRGAFRGEELAGVGTLRNKLAAYLQAVQEAAEKEQPQDTSEVIN